ncbi:BON domain-containing protein [Pollutimonas subterranea]|nr:BON domain-containing protein [Pollutimonas subterranea]
MTNDDRRNRQPSKGRESDWQGPGSGDERHGTRRSAGVHATEQGEQLRSRSADPGQSSYGGFANEDPRFQRQQIEHFEGGRGYGGNHQGSQGGQQQGWRNERQQHVYGRQRIQPKGYTRSDERIREDVCERLSHSGLDVSEVSVNVAEAKVTLEGTVKDRRIKHSIEDCAEDCTGVVDVDNRITVQRDETGGYVR